MILDSSGFAAERTSKFELGCPTSEDYRLVERDASSAACLRCSHLSWALQGDGWYPPPQGQTQLYILLTKLSWQAHVRLSHLCAKYTNGLWCTLSVLSLSLCQDCLIGVFTRHKPAVHGAPRKQCSRS
jgi:hypothetical protein